jgi:endonuclease III
MLNTEKALKLYLLLKDHFPPNAHEFDFIQLMRIIIDSMVSSNQHKNYTDSIMLMYDVELDALKDSTPMELIEMFSKGLVENNIAELISFFNQKVRYGIS